MESGDRFEAQTVQGGPYEPGVCRPCSLLGSGRSPDLVDFLIHTNIQTADQTPN
jgi:hypothetical protein